MAYATHLEHLDLLVLAHAELSRVLPMRGMLPSMLSKTTLMAILLQYIHL